MATGVLTIPRGEFNQFLAQQLHITEIWQLRHRCQNSQSLEIRSNSYQNLRLTFPHFGYESTPQIEISQKILKILYLQSLFFGLVLDIPTKKTPNDQPVGDPILEPSLKYPDNIPVEAASACRRRPCLMVMVTQDQHVGAPIATIGKCAIN